MSKNTISISEWNEQQFAEAKVLWSELLQRSSADQLFLSWEWLYSWWSIFAQKDSMQLRLYVATDSDGQLVGIAPLYISHEKTKKVLSVSRLQFIGGCWRGKATMYTEMMQFIIDTSCSRGVVEAFYRHIGQQRDWDEFVLSDLLVDSETCQELMQTRPFTPAYYRINERFNSFYLPLRNDFASYLASLGKNTRLKLFNRRKLLEQHGEVRVEETCQQDIEKNFDLLNRLHSERWGRPAFSEGRKQFNLTLAHFMAEKNALNFSVMYVADVPLSIQYNYIVNRREYNIQAGFSENFDKKIALGYLHFGYAIENAYKRQLSAYDFLAGSGKNDQYKNHLTDCKLEINEIQIIRSRHLQLIYRLYDLIKRLRNNRQATPEVA